MYNKSTKFQCVSHHIEALLINLLFIFINLEKGVILVDLRVTKSKVVVNIFLNRNWKILFSLWCSLKKSFTRSISGIIYTPDDRVLVSYEEQEFLMTRLD